VRREQVCDRPDKRRSSEKATSEMRTYS